MDMALPISKRLLVLIFSFVLGCSMVIFPGLKASATVSWGQEVIEVGKHSIGAKFKWGGNNPKQGFDASGYTHYVYKTSAAKLTLPRTSKDQYKLGKSIEKPQLKQGDLVFFNTTGKGVSFVGIYDSKGNFLAATSKGVSYQSLNNKYWKDRYIGAKRILTN